MRVPFRARINLSPPQILFFFQNFFFPTPSLIIADRESWILLPSPSRKCNLRSTQLTTPMAPSRNGAPDRPTSPNSESSRSKVRDNCYRGAWALISMISNSTASEAPIDGDDLAFWDKSSVWVQSLWGGRELVQARTWSLNFYLDTDILLYGALWVAACF